MKTMERRKGATIRIDENIILTMVVVSFIAMVVLAFKYHHYAPCVPVKFFVKSNSFQTGELIYFQVEAKNTGNLVWDFGDLTISNATSATAVHAYDHPGQYTISLAVNDICKAYKTIYITKAPLLVNPALVARFICPRTAEVGKPVVFKDTTANAASWEWRFGETTNVDAITQTATFTYFTPGVKTVYLVINGNMSTPGICKIFVAPKTIKADQRSNKAASQRIQIYVPERPNIDPLDSQLIKLITIKPPLDDKPKAPDLTGSQMEVLLREVVIGTKQAANFSPYLCGSLDTKINCNNRQISFTDLCIEMRSIKKTRKIKSLDVQLIKNQQTNCIIDMNVTLRLKKGQSLPE